MAAKRRKAASTRTRRRAQLNKQLSRLLIAQSQLAAAMALAASARLALELERKKTEETDVKDDIQDRQELESRIMDNLAAAVSAMQQILSAVAILG